MRLQTIIERHWYVRMDPILVMVLFPFSIIYEVVIFMRKLLFLLCIKRKTKLNVPVVVIGNITVGGAGKTPLTKHLASQLIARGINVGIILRGYKSTTKTATIVSATDSSTTVGDEALIYAQAGFKVAIGSKRVLAAKLLLQTYPEIQIILADDGMQHYYLARDMEICVVDSSRMFGNQQLLPTGPLREPMTRLNKVSAVVVNGAYNSIELAEILKKYTAPIYHQELELIDFFNPSTQTSKSAIEMAKSPVVALAAIGNPARFYDYLEKFGLKIKGVKSFPDHYHYQAHDIISEYAIITTEKDYTKLAKFKPSNVWIARVEAKLNNDTLIEQITNLVHKPI